MKRDDFFKEGDDGRWWYEHFSACMNERYHGEMAARFRKKDDNIRIAVGFIAIAGLVITIFSLFPQSGTIWFWAVFVLSFALSVGSLCVAYVLNVFPFKEKELLHIELQRRWNDLRYELELLRNSIERSSVVNLKEDHLERFEDLLRKKAVITDDEPPTPDKKLLDECYFAENERRHGTGNRTDTQVRDLRDKKAAASQPAAANAS